jgi:hypothetical protein
MGHWSSSKCSTNYEDKNGEEVNQPTPSPEHEEYPLPAKEPAKDDGDPTDDEEEEEVPSATEEEEEKEEEEEADNITETIPRGFTPMSHYKKRRLNPPSPNTTWRTRMTPHWSRMTRRAATMAMAGQRRRSVGVVN